jgi:hypothetical protein
MHQSVFAEARSGLARRVAYFKDVPDRGSRSTRLRPVSGRWYSSTWVYVPERLRAVLAQLLPGVREVRAPLASGYLWLLLVWLVWGDDLGRAANAREGDQPSVIQRLTELEAVVQGIGLAVVVSVTAYVMGSWALPPGGGGFGCPVRSEAPSLDSA